MNKLIFQSVQCSYSFVFVDLKWYNFIEKTVWNKWRKKAKNFFLQRFVPFLLSCFNLTWISREEEREQTDSWQFYLTVEALYFEHLSTSYFCLYLFTYCFLNIIFCSFPNFRYTQQSTLKCASINSKLQAS